LNFRRRKDADAAIKALESNGITRRRLIDDDGEDEIDSIIFDALQW
jgi:hypothetical protein